MKARKVCLYTLFAVFVLLVAAPSYAIVYVSQSGNNANDGLSWATSKLTIQAGVNLAAAQTDKTVWVAVGTLPPPALPAQPIPIAYVENVTVPAGIGVYGGFRGDETLPFDLDSRTLKTIVHAKVSGTAIFSAGTGVVIDGFIIENNTADRGAGIFCTGTSCTVANDIIRGNSARLGAGIFADGASLLVRDSQFSGNTVTDNSGVIASGASIYERNGSLIILRSSFANETARVGVTSGDYSQGGSIYASGGTFVKLDQTTFDNCVANGTTQTVIARGGAVYSTWAMITITNSLFHNCAARGLGDVKPALGGAIFLENPITPDIINNTFVGDEVTPQAGLVTDADRPYGQGAAIYMSGNNPARILNNIIAYSRGTAVVNNGMTTNFNYNLLWHNAGGDIYGLNFPVHAPPTSVDGNIMKDPQFLMGDVLFHITVGSPAKDAGINVGAPGFDIDGETRPWPAGGKVDIGADEFVDTDGDGGANTNPLETSPTTITAAETDTDGDGIRIPYDNCPTSANPHQVDSNGDGLGDVCEGIPPVFYVDASVAASGNGLSWATAFKTIQEGINAADLHNQTNVDGATPWTGVNPQVWVKKGTYNENVLLWHGVYAYGGFAGNEIVNPNVLSGRQPLVNTSQINGGAFRSTVVIAHLPQDRYLTGTTKTRYDNLQPTIDGFLITNGKAEIGGGVSVYKETANISTDRINSNTAALGGGVYLYKSYGIVGDGIGPAPGNLLTGDTAILLNTATGVATYAGFGGGVYAERGSPTIFANIIENNTAFWGGGAAARESDPVFVENLIGCQTAPNTANGGATGNGKGGGVYLDSHSNGAFEEDTIVSNVAVGAGGQGGGVWLKQSDMTMNLTIVASNTAAAGAAIWADSPAAQVVIYPLCYITKSDFFPVVATSFFGIANPTTNIPGSPCALTNKAVDPLFVNPAACNYRLQAGSTLRFPIGPNMGAFQDVDPPVNVGESKGLDNGITAEISGAIVTAVFPDGFYIEDPSRTSGIKVIAQDAQVQEGQLVNVTGVLTTLDNERQLINAQFSGSVGVASVVMPVGISNRMLGGGAVGNWTVKLKKGIGLNNVGLLVKTWGKVTATGSSPYLYFTIDDGSGVGVKVRVRSGDSLPKVGQFATVTGISGVEADTGGGWNRLIRTRRSSDVVCPQ